MHFSCSSLFFIVTDVVHQSSIFPQGCQLFGICNCGPTLSIGYKFSASYIIKRRFAMLCLRLRHYPNNDITLQYSRYSHTQVFPKEYYYRRMTTSKRCVCSSINKYPYVLEYFLGKYVSIHGAALKIPLFHFSLTGYTEASYTYMYLCLLLCHM